MPISRIEFRIESTGEWVGASERDPADEDGLRLIGAGKTGVLEVLYSDIPGNSWNQNRLNKFTERANQLLEYRIPLTDPSLADDPAGPNGSDPARPDFYWDNGDLVSRSVVVSEPTFIDGVLNFVVTDARLWA
jgi:hypothetical protein